MGLLMCIKHHFLLMALLMCKKPLQMKKLVFMDTEHWQLTVSMNTSFFLQAEGHSADSTGDQSPIHKYASSDGKSDSQSDGDSQSLREDDSQSDHNSDDAHNSSSDEDHSSQHDNDNSLYSDDSSNEWQSTSLKRKLPEEVQAKPGEPTEGSIVLQHRLL